MNVTLKLNNLPVPVDHFTFNGGEEQVKISPAHTPKGDIGYVSIYAKLKSSKDVMTLVMLTDACRHLSNLETDAKFTLHMPYIPYARQDRLMNSGESYAISAFVSIISTLNFDCIYVDDPHSDVATALLDRATKKLVVRTQGSLFFEYFGTRTQLEHLRGDKSKTGKLVIVAPDAGAGKKARKIADAYHLPIVEASKVRNVYTGEITDTQVHGDVLGSTCIIVDDICDGGRTFLPLAEALKERGAVKVILYVTHGIFSNGKESLLLGGIDSLFSYHDWTLAF